MSESKALDGAGLQRVWDRITALLAGKADASHIHGTSDVDGLGDRETHDQSTAISLASGGYTVVASVTLDPGVWVICGTVQFATNATGSRIAVFSTASSANASDLRQTANRAVPPSGSQSTYVNTCCTKSYSSQTTVNLLGWQNSGSALNGYGCITAVRIA